MNENKQQKGILQTNSKPNASKTRRISWGEIKVKEYESNGEVSERKDSLNYNNITIGGFPNDTILEESSSYESGSRTSSMCNKSK
jgi:hypothetical protein